MQSKSDALYEALSTARLTPYLDAATGDPTLALAHYRQNVLLCEALYPSLHFLEVTLRNRFESLLVQQFGDRWFAESGLVTLLTGSPGEGQLQEAVTKLRRLGRSVSSGGIIAELSFGFWTSLLGNRYRGRISGPGRWILFPNQPGGSG